MNKETSELRDEELVSRARVGRDEAFGELVRRYRDDVVRVVRWTSAIDPERVEDVAQETFLRAWRGLGHFRGECPFRRWLLGIAVRATLNEAARASARWARRTRSLDGEGAAPEPIDRSTPPPDAGLLRRELAGALAAALDRLDPVYRTAVVLRDVEGLSYEEIAELLDVPVGTVRSRIHRGRAALRADLERTGFEGGLRAPGGVG